MGWSIGYDNKWQRDIGYGVPAVCDHPRCNEEIDRGLGYVCGGEPYGGDKGCGLFFCSRHLWFGRSKDAPQLCGKCMRYDHRPYKPKPDIKVWVGWKLKHPSWRKWRSEHPAEVLAMRTRLYGERVKNETNTV